VYKISEFSKITNLSVKTLRYYDQEGILKPSSRAENAYRYYDQNDFKKAELVKFLRDMDFSIAEIKDMFANYETDEDLAYFLAEKRIWIAQRISNEQELMRKIDHYLVFKKEEHDMNYKIESKEIQALDVASIRFKGAYQEVGKYLGIIYGKAKNKASGAPFSCYYDTDFAEIADIEVCVPTRGLVKIEGLCAKRIPGIQAVSTMHVGGYETLNLAYKALLDYASEHDLAYGLPSREIYHKGPGMLFRGNPNKYVTEIIIPLEKDKI
jgi:DNA-binding transcriptional MerR regulator